MKSDMNAEKNLAWHYTTSHKFLQIMSDGLLKPTGVFINPCERPVLWFSTNQGWEATANKMVQNKHGQFRRLTKRETFLGGGGLVRFGCPADLLMTWPQLRQAARISRNDARILEKSGRKQGANPSAWRGTLQPIQVCDLAVDAMEEYEQWVRIQALPDGNVLGPYTDPAASVSPSEVVGVM